MSSVFQKELRQYFHAVSGYVFLAIFLFFCGYYFVLGNLFSQNGDIGTFFLSILMVVMFLLPLITMRAFAEAQTAHRPAAFHFSGGNLRSGLGKAACVACIFLHRACRDAFIRGNPRLLWPV